MTKFFASRISRAFVTVALTIATVALWGATTHAAESKDSCDASRWTEGTRIGCTTVEHFGTRKAPALMPTSKIAAALHYAPLGAAPGNPPSAARAQMAKYNVPGGCVITYTIRKSDSAVLRHTHCEYSPALISRLASSGK